MRHWHLSPRRLQPVQVGLTSSPGESTTEGVFSAGRLTFSSAPAAIDAAGAGAFPRGMAGSVHGQLHVAVHKGLRSLRHDHTGVIVDGDEAGMMKSVQTAGEKLGRKVARSGKDTRRGGNVGKSGFPQTWHFRNTCYPMILSSIHSTCSTTCFILSSIRSLASPATPIDACQCSCTLSPVNSRSTCSRVRLRVSG